MTFNTPATLYTALSDPHALSESDVPIATMKVTYVVDNGNLNDVAIEIRIAATIIFTEALIISKAGNSTAFFELISTTGTSN